MQHRFLGIWIALLAKDCDPGAILAKVIDMLA
jgi:hypothetical protein